MCRLYLVDDHTIFLRGLTLLLDEQEGFSVVGTAENGVKLLADLDTVETDVLVLDIQLPDTDAETLLQHIRRKKPELPILYHTMMRGTRYLHRLMQHGVQGYLLKSAPVDELITALKTVASGKTYFSSEINITITGEEDYRNTVTVPDTRVTEILSRREVEVLQMVCREYSSADIAAKLFLSVSTVDTHRKNIIQKLGVNNTVGLVKFALKHGLIDG